MAVMPSPCFLRAFSGWRLTAPSGEKRQVRTAGWLSVNDGQSLLNAAISGLGIAYLPSFLFAEAKEQGLVEEAIPEIAVNRRLGLIIYGPGGVDECSGLDLRFSPMPNAAGQIINDVNALNPEGSTALTEAVRIAAQTLDHKAKPGSIVLVTDGKETCGGAPCQLAAELAKESVSLTVHVIGYKVRGDYFAYPNQSASDYLNSETVSRCLADQTGGKYVSAETVDELIEAFRETLGCKFLF